MTLDRSRPGPWLAALGVADAPVTRAGVLAALQFFAQHMPALSVNDQLGFLRGIDLHHPVRQVCFAPGLVIAAFRYSTQDPFRLFYTKSGTSLHRLGVNPAGREFRRFRVVGVAQVLESRCASARQTWNSPAAREAFAGGGLQYIVPRADQVLVRVP